MNTYIGKSCRIRYNPDLSGNATITASGKEIEVLAKDLDDFIQMIFVLSKGQPDRMFVVKQ